MAAAAALDDSHYISTVMFCFAGCKQISQWRDNPLK